MGSGRPNRYSLQPRRTLHPFPLTRRQTYLARVAQAVVHPTRPARAFLLRGLEVALRRSAGGMAFAQGPADYSSPARAIRHAREGRGASPRGKRLLKIGHDT